MAMRKRSLASTQPAPSPTEVGGGGPWLPSQLPALREPSGRCLAPASVRLRCLPRPSSLSRLVRLRVSRRTGARRPLHAITDPTVKRRTLLEQTAQSGRPSWPGSEAARGGTGLSAVAAVAEVSVSLAAVVEDRFAQLPGE